MKIKLGTRPARAVATLNCQAALFSTGPLSYLAAKMAFAKIYEELMSFMQKF